MKWEVGFLEYVVSQLVLLRRMHCWEQQDAQTFGLATLDILDVNSFKLNEECLRPLILMVEVPVDVPHRLCNCSASQKKPFGILASIPAASRLRGKLSRPSIRRYHHTIYPTLLLIAVSHSAEIVGGANKKPQSKTWSEFRIYPLWASKLFISTETPMKNVC